MATRAKATIEDLYQIEEKAEIVNGEIVRMRPTSGKPNLAAVEILVSLHAYARRTGSGMAVSDNAAFRVHLPNRESFSPDVAYYIGPDPGMKFFEGAPVFAVEVGSENDYGPKAEEQIARKRADYFAAGTLVVWDVDLLGEDVVRVYRASDPENPTIYRKGDTAEAEPAVPGWSMKVDELLG
jgi:Uma2 family endonuclease